MIKLLAFIGILTITKLLIDLLTYFVGLREIIKNRGVKVIYKNEVIGAISEKVCDDLYIGEEIDLEGKLYVVRDKINVKMLDIGSSLKYCVVE